MLDNHLGKKGGREGGRNQLTNKKCGRRQGSLPACDRHKSESEGRTVAADAAGPTERAEGGKLGGGGMCMLLIPVV